MQCFLQFDWTVQLALSENIVIALYTFDLILFLVCSLSFFVLFTN